MSIETWQPTEEQFVFQQGEGRGARYKIAFADGEEHEMGEGDEAFLAAIRARDEYVRNRATRGALTEAPQILTPPEPGDPCVIAGAELVGFVEDTPNAIVKVAGVEIEVPYDSLTKDINAEALG